MDFFSLSGKFNPFHTHGVVRKKWDTLFSLSFIYSFNKYLLSIHYVNRQEIFNPIVMELTTKRGKQVLDRHNKKVRQIYHCKMRNAMQIQEYSVRRNYTGRKLISGIRESGSDKRTFLMDSLKNITS